MFNEELVFQGRRDRVDELLTDLDSVGEILSSELKTVSSTSNEILGREPFNQHELAEVVIAVTINVASSALYDIIRQNISERAKKKGFALKYREMNSKKIADADD